MVGEAYGEARGRATFAVTKDDAKCLICEERGDMKYLLSGESFEFQFSLRFKLNEDGSLAVTRGDGTFLYDLVLEEKSGRAIGEHLCDADLYRGEYDFKSMLDGGRSFQFRHLVNGPKKADVIVTTLERTNE